MSSPASPPPENPSPPVPPAPREGSASGRRPNAIRRLYDWTLSWSDRPGGTRALAAFSFAESSFFPIPPDVLLMALAMGRPRRAFWFATVAMVFSVLGGVLGYYIGLVLFDQIGRPILEFYGASAHFDRVGELYRENLVVALGTAGFTPIPYKVFTIAGGAFEVPLLPFIVISFFSRGARFFLVAGLIYVFGPPIKSFIDRYFNVLTVVFVVLLVGGFVVVRYAIH